MGTPKNMPGTPARPPPTRMATTTQKLEMPVDSPRIFGPMTLPSSCCRRIMKMMKYRHFSGLASRIRKALGTAPRKGPKNGITLVMPTMTLTRGV